MGEGGGRSSGYESIVRCGFVIKVGYWGLCCVFGWGVEGVYEVVEVCEGGVGVMYLWYFC